MAERADKAAEIAAHKKSSVQSLAKAFRMLEAIAAAEANMTLSEIAAPPPSTPAPPTACSIR